MNSSGTPSLGALPGQDVAAWRAFQAFLQTQGNLSQAASSTINGSSQQAPPTETALSVPPPPFPTFGESTSVGHHQPVLHTLTRPASSATPGGLATPHQSSVNFSFGTSSSIMAPPTPTAQAPATHVLPTAATPPLTFGFIPPGFQANIPQHTVQEANQQRLNHSRSSRGRGSGRGRGGAAGSLARGRGGPRASIPTLHPYPGQPVLDLRGPSTASPASDMQPVVIQVFLWEAVCSRCSCPYLCSLLT